MQFCIFGSYGQNNIGDEAIADGIVKMLHTVLPGSKAILFTHNVSESKNLHPHFVDWRPMIATGFRSWLKQNKSGDWKKNKMIIQKSDWIIIGGGGIFHDKEIKQSGPNPLLIWWLRTLFFKYWRKKIILWAVGIGPIEKPISKFFLKGILKRADIITVRDQASDDITKTLTTKNTHIIPDPVWGLFEPTKSLTQKKILGINIRENHRLPQAKLLTQLVQTIKIPLEQKALEEIWLIPFALGNPDDRELMNTILPQLQKDFSLPIAIKTPDSPEEAFQLISSCSHFIAMRFHSYIFAMSANTPCTMLSYSSKTDEITKHKQQYYLEQQKRVTLLLQKLLS